MAMAYENPAEYVQHVMSEFDEALEFDPENSAEAVADRRAYELMQEVA